MKLALAVVSSLALVAVATPISSRDVSSDVTHCLEGSSCTQLNNIWKLCNKYSGADAEVNTGNCLCNDPEVRSNTEFYGYLSCVEDIQRGNWAGIAEKASSLYDSYCNTASFNIKFFEATSLGLSLASGFPFVIPAGTPFSLVSELKAREYSDNTGTVAQTSAATTNCETTSSTATAGGVETSLSSKSSATSASPISTTKSSSSESSSSNTYEESTSATSTAGGIEMSLSSKSSFSGGVSTVSTTKSSTSGISTSTVPPFTMEYTRSTTAASTAGGVVTSVNPKSSSTSLTSVTSKSSKIQSSSTPSGISISLSKTSSIITTATPSCNEDNCLRAFEAGNGQDFCSSFTATSLYNAALPTYASQCTGSSLARISSACTCLNLKSSSSSTRTIELTTFLTDTFTMTFLTDTFTIGRVATTLTSKLPSSTGLQVSENCTTTSAFASISTVGGFATSLSSNSSIHSVKTITPTITSTNIVTAVSVPDFSGYQTTYSFSSATAEGVEVTLSSRTLSTLDVNIDVTTTTLETISATPTTFIIGTSIVILTSSLQPGNFESTVTAPPTTVVVASTVVIISSLGSAPTSTFPLPESIIEGSSPSIIISIITALPEMASTSIVAETISGPTLPVQLTSTQTSAAEATSTFTSPTTATSAIIPTTLASTETISIPISSLASLVSETQSQTAASSSTAAQGATSPQLLTEVTSGSTLATVANLSAGGLLSASASQSSAPAQGSGSTSTLIALTGSAINVAPASSTPVPESESAASSGSTSAETLTVIPQSASTAISAPILTGSSPSSAGSTPSSLFTELTSVLGSSAASSSSTQLSSTTAQSVVLNTGYSVSSVATTAYAVCSQCTSSTVTVTQIQSSTSFTLTPLTVPVYSTESVSPSMSCIPGMIGVTVAGSAQLPECSSPTENSILQSSSAAESSIPPLYVSVPATSTALSGFTRSAANITIVPVSSLPSGALPPVPTTTYSQQATGDANMNNIKLAFLVGFVALAILI